MHTEANHFPQDERRPVEAQLEKILASATFRSAISQRDFLRYTVHETLAGRGHLLKEYLIATEALGRDAPFDPRLDPIVRTQARKLRARLARYYGSEGAGDPILIEFPKGSYQASFVERDLLESEKEVSTSHEPVAALPWSWPMAPKATLKSAAAGVLLALLGFYLGSQAQTRPALAGNPSVAVMPFANLGGEPQDEFLSDGLTNELIESLGQAAWLQVVARNSAFRFKGKQLTSREVAQQLKVTTLLEGGIRRSGDRLHVTVQLNNATDGAHLWSGSFDRDAKHAREIQLEIARAVTDVLSIHFALPPRKKTEVVEGRQPVPSAYQSYLRGRFFWNKISADTWKTAVDYFEQAIAEDPTFAGAYSGLASSYVMAPQLTGVPALEVVPKIRSAANKALELDATLGEAHFDLAVCSEYEFDWETAEREFKTGLELSPGNAVGHLWYAKYLAMRGRKDEVYVQRRIAASLDPVSPYAVQAVGGYLSVTGKYDEAIAHFRGALALDPGFGLAHQGLGVAFLLRGMHEEAIAELREAERLMGGPGRKALLGYVYGMTGHATEARQILSGFLARYPREPFTALSIAHVYLGLGDRDRAFEWMAKAVDQHDIDLTLQWDSLYDPLRSDPRYSALLRRMNLLDKQ